MATTPGPLLRDGLLDGVGVLVATGGPPEELGMAAAGSCGALGAAVTECRLDPQAAPDDQEAAAERDAAAALAAGPLRVLVVDVASLFAGGGFERLLAPLAGTWAMTRAVANAALIPAADGGRVLLIAPRPDAGEHAAAAIAATENLARTLSIEWARHRVTAVAIAPGAGTPAASLGELVAYLASAAGDYFSGCLLDLRGVAV
jgi:citronellol/citronellal dehydrogenase